MVRIPEVIDGVGPEAVPGWSVSTQTGTSPEPIDVGHGGTITARVAPAT